MNIFLHGDGFVNDKNLEGQEAMAISISGASSLMNAGISVWVKPIWQEAIVFMILWTYFIDISFTASEVFTS